MFYISAIIVALYVVIVPTALAIHIIIDALADRYTTRIFEARGRRKYRLMRSRWLR